MSENRPIPLHLADDGTYILGDEDEEMSRFGSANLTLPSPSPCSLYRFFNQDGALLYVGITDHLPGRMSEHAREKEWWREVSTVTVEHFDSRAEARRAEQAAMDDGRPARNRVRSVGKTPLRSFRMSDDIYRPAQEQAAMNGETMTDVVRRALEDYVEGDD